MLTVRMLWRGQRFGGGGGGGGEEGVCAGVCVCVGGGCGEVYKATINAEYVSFNT